MKDIWTWSFPFGVPNPNYFGMFFNLLQDNKLLLWADVIIVLIGLGLFYFINNPKPSTYRNFNIRLLVSAVLLILFNTIFLSARYNIYLNPDVTVHPGGLIGFSFALFFINLVDISLMVLIICIIYQMLGKFFPFQCKIRANRYYPFAFIRKFKI